MVRGAGLVARLHGERGGEGEEGKRRWRKSEGMKGVSTTASWAGILNKMPAPVHHSTEQSISYHTILHRLTVCHTMYTPHCTIP